MIDKANFYKLPETEQKKELENLWVNTSEDVESFANNLVEEIKYSNTPFVLGIDGGYGTGKTYFSTRFTEYLKAKDINAIYCSVWENDYLENPFIAISKEIIKSINSATIKSKTKTVLEKLNDSIVNVFSCLNISVPIKNVEVSANVKDVYKAIAKPWIEQKKDEIQQFKSDMGNFIKYPNGEKLVLVVDELDRCRPDFAVKTLEILKHLFDIEGLYVILMINKDRLSQHINAFYNIQVIGEEKEEGYLAKFINRYEHIPNLNYEVIVDDILKTERLKHAIDKGNITEDETKFNSFSILRKNIINSCNMSHITYRETKELVEKCIEFCINYNESIRCECLPYEFVENNSPIKTIIEDPKIYRIRNVLIDNKNTLISLIKQNISNLRYGYINGDVKCDNWKDIDELYSELSYRLSIQNNFGINNRINKDDFNIISQLYKKLKFLEADDNDEIRVKNYEKIAKEFNKLYSNKNIKEKDKNENIS